jgi:hypothetical protein
MTNMNMADYIVLGDARFSLGDNQGTGPASWPWGIAKAASPTSLPAP